MSVPVVWRNYLEGVQARGFWDQSLLGWLFEQEMPGGFKFEHLDEFPDHDQGIVLVAPGHFRDTEQINEDLRGRPWVLVIVTSDEEAAAPFWDIHHPNMSIWKHWPNPELPWQPDRILPLGWTPGTLEANPGRPEKDLDWFFAGQITHLRREQAAAVMRTMSGGKLIETAGFTQGVARSEWFEMLRRSRVIPCPSGPNTPDTFRFYEALESGSVPLADAISPRVDRNGDRGYWHRAFGDVPFPVVEDWSTLPRLVEEYRQQSKRVEVLAWWEQAKRDLLWRLHDDLLTLGAELPTPPVTEQMTVLIPTSPIPSHPSTDIIEETVASVRENLRLAEILVMADGVRPELEHRREAYTEYLERLVWLCRQWKAVPLVLPWGHQANATRRALELVRTDLVLFVEHDTPLVGPIPWAELGHFILDDSYNLIRFHHETSIPKEHDWLMRDTESKFKNGKNHPFMRTVQWSQRPHLARTQKYREWIDQYFPVTSRTMVEDRMHGVVDRTEWEDFRVVIYHPKGGIQRSRHLNGREGDSKYEELMHW